ncbi:MAG: metallophosphoesterase [Pseudolabrys sp.]
MLARSVIAGLAWLVAAQGVAAQGTLEAAYVLLGPQGTLARAVVSGGSACPAVAVNGASQPMAVRSSGNSAFPVLVCELPLQAGTTSAVLAGRNLPLPPATLASVAVLGDTGCRLKSDGKALKQVRRQVDHADGKFQDCDVVSQWPFSALAASVAAKKPQLVVHVGDYNYRESPCPPGDAGCQGSPYGDNWPTWKADFFAPGAPLLAAAPWIAARGNHESCSRAGAGYMLFLDPTPARDGKPPACIDLLPVFTVAVGGQSFVVMDSSNADDVCPCNSAPYAKQFAALRPTPGSWLVTHRPVWGFNPKGPINPTLQGALQQWQGKLPPGITLAVAGHIHLWEAIGFADGRSPQFVIGNGGTALDKQVGPLTGKKIGGTTVSYADTKDEWGFALFSPGSAAGNWTARYYSVEGNEKFSCAVTPTAVSC